jgi:hypothetical protein
MPTVSNFLKASIRSITDNLSKIYGKNTRNEANREYPRYRCSCLATMTIANRSIIIEGIISDISLFGLTFRPSKVYIVNRDKTQVLIEFLDFRISGNIVSSRTDGYGIYLFKQLEKEKMEKFLDNFGSEVLNKEV